MNRKKVILLLSVCILGILGVLGMILLFIYKEDKNKIIMVRGFQIEFNVSDARLKVDDFDQIEIGMSFNEIEQKIGEADDWIGCGVEQPLYFLKDGKVMACRFENTNTLQNLKMLEVYESDKSYIYKE